MALVKVKSRGTDNETGRKNLIINGGMQVAQRATSVASISSTGYHTLDRFEYYVAGIDELRITMSQDSSVPTGADSGFSKSLKIDCTTAESAIAADENVRVWQLIEAQNLTRLGYGTSGAKSTTLSFYVKSSLTGTYAVSFWCQDSGRNITKTYTINTADTWEKKTVTIPGDTGGTGINIDNGEGMRINWFLNAGSNFTSTNTNNQWDTFASGRYAFGHTAAWGTNTSHNFFLTGVQFEVGNSATDFEHRLYAEEFALCQRYFYKTGSLGQAEEWYPGVQTYQGYDSVHASSMNDLNDRCAPEVQFPVPMRARPTVVYYPGRGGVAATAGSITVYNANTSVTTSSKPAGGTQGLNGYFQGTSTDSSSYTFQFTADAEL